MFSLILSTFGLIFLAELPDKTGLAPLVLATRDRAWDRIAGTWLAFFVQTAIAVLAGSLLHLLPARPVHLASGLGFLVFAVLAFRRLEEEEVAASSARRTARLTSFLVVFAAERGDLTSWRPPRWWREPGSRSRSPWAPSPVSGRCRGCRQRRIAAGAVVFAGIGVVIIVLALCG